MTAKKAQKLIQASRLREAFKGMDPHQAQAIREAYYKAVEGLTVLTDLLQQAESSGIEFSGALVAESQIAAAAQIQLDKSTLGAVL